MKKEFNSFDIQIGDSCNLKCLHCCMKNSMQNNCIEFDKIKDFLYKQKEVKEVHLAGGEPLLFNTDKTLDLIKSFPHVYWKITTNLCYDLTEERIEILKRVNSLQTSFDLHIRFGNIRNLLKWYRNVRYLLDNVRSDVELFVSITKYTVKKDHNRWMRFFNRLGVNGYKYILLANVGSLSINKDIMVGKEEYVRWMHKVLDTHDEKKNQTVKLIREKNMTNCHYGTTMQPISIHGEPIHCGITERSNDNCRVNPECLMCKDFRYCGGKCVLIPCMFDKSIYDRAMNEYFNDQGSVLE